MLVVLTSTGTQNPIEEHCGFMKLSMCQTILISFHDRMTGHAAWRQAAEAIYLSLIQAFNFFLHVMPSSQLGK